MSNLGELISLSLRCWTGKSFLSNKSWLGKQQVSLIPSAIGSITLIASTAQEIKKNCSIASVKYFLKKLHKLTYVRLDSLDKDLWRY